MQPSEFTNGRGERLDLGEDTATSEANEPLRIDEIEKMRAWLKEQGHVVSMVDHLANAEETLTLGTLDQERKEDDDWNDGYRNVA